MLRKNEALETLVEFIINGTSKLLLLGHGYYLAKNIDEFGSN